MIEVLEVWGDGRHYFLLPNGVQIDVPQPPKPGRPSDT